MTCTPCAHSTRSVGWLINNWIVKNKNMESKEPGVGEGPAKVVSVSLPEGTVRLLFGEDISESLLELLSNGRVGGKGRGGGGPGCPGRQPVGRCLSCPGRAGARERAVGASGPRWPCSPLNCVPRG